MGNLPYKYTEKELREVFGAVGPIKDLRMREGFCFLEYENEKDGDAAIEQHHQKTDMGGRIVRVEWSKCTNFFFFFIGIGNVLMIGLFLSLSFQPREERVEEEVVVAAAIVDVLLGGNDLVIFFFFLVAMMEKKNTTHS